jgi:hypothetical protein
VCAEHLVTASYAWRRHNFPTLKPRRKARTNHFLEECSAFSKDTPS